MHNVVLTPRQIVEELDKYIIGQRSAKRAVAIALRNRYRRSQLDDELMEEITPKNILMMGPTGVGKTEIARRLAKLLNAPFVKVEATKFTEVGYVGRDVDSMIRDLVEAAIRMIKDQRIEFVRPEAQRQAKRRLIAAIVPGKKPPKRTAMFNIFGGPVPEDEPEQADTNTPDTIREQRQSVADQLDKGLLEDMMIDIEVEESSTIDMSGMGQAMEINLGDMMGGLLPKRTKQRRVKVSEARRVFEQEEAQKLIDMDEVTSTALKLAEQNGIVFIDEIDKIAGRSGAQGGPDVSREGVQRDILPLIEGSTITTKYGPIKTDYMLFIAAGAFHVAKVDDLIPELQGRFPILVELSSLSEADFRLILTQPQNALIKQYSALLAVDGVYLEFTEEGISAIAHYAYLVNEHSENIGARRLHTILESLLEEVSFNAQGDSDTLVRIDADYVQKTLRKVLAQKDLARYIL